MIEKLKTDIESAINRKMVSPLDFTFLQERILVRTNKYLSTTTLKRLWGYVREEVNTRRTTLDILATFLGYADFAAYANLRNQTLEEGESNPVVSSALYSSDLTPGVKLQLTWAPDRVCIVRYMGNDKFIIVESQKTRLQPEDIFRCRCFIEGEPLYIDLLDNDGALRSVYVCGKKNGIRYKLL